MGTFHWVYELLLPMHTQLSCIEGLTETFNSELKSLKEWLQSNKLSLNIIKSQAMVIRSRLNLKKITVKAVHG